MYVRTSVPRPVGELLDDVIRLYRGSFAYCWLPGLIMALISGALSIYVTKTLVVHGAPAQQMAIFRSPQFLSGEGLILVISIWIYCAMVSNVNTVAMGEPASVWSGFIVGLRALPSAILATIVFLVIAAVGLVLLVIPGVYLWNRLQLGIVTLVVERTGPFTALSRSWRLVQGHWWRTFTVISVAFILVFVVALAFGFVASIAAASLHLDMATRLMLTRAANALWYIFFIPVMPATLVAVYRDLKLRKEGGDLAARVSRLHPA